MSGPLDDGGALSVWVHGRPRPKGSLTVVHGERGHLVDSPASQTWRGRMADVVGTVTDWGRGDGWPIREAVILTATFVFRRPLSGPHVDSDWPDTTIVGDYDKLLRNAMDALKDGGAYDDDSRVVGMGEGVRKMWIPAGSGMDHGAYLRLDLAGSP